MNRLGSAKGGYMPPVKSLDRISAKWARVAQVSGPEYEAGVTNPRRSWMQATAAAEANFEKGVQAAIQRKSFGKGVKAAGDDKWQKNTLQKGAVRWAAGINLAKGAFEAGFAPYRAVIERTTLPARGPKGDPANIQRVAIIADALHKEKLKIKGA